MKVIIRGIINKREKARDVGEAESHEDLLDLLLDSYSMQTKGNELTTDEIMEECQLFYFAGQKTFRTIGLDYDFAKSTPRLARSRTRGSDSSFWRFSRQHIHVLLIHRDPKLWGSDAAEYGVLKATKNQVCFLPFGWDPRICIGHNFALLEAKMTLALIIRRFSFELSPSYVHAPYTVTTIHPHFGAHLILHKI
ncbi:unnamed protein product [Cochlearia groenlandica]